MDKDLNIMFDVNKKAYVYIKDGRIYKKMDNHIEHSTKHTNKARVVNRKKSIRLVPYLLAVGSTILLAYECCPKKVNAEEKIVYTEEYNAEPNIEIIEDNDYYVDSFGTGNAEDIKNKKNEILQAQMNAEANTSDSVEEDNASNSTTEEDNASDSTTEEATAETPVFIIDTDDKSGTTPIQNANNYDEIFNKYSSMYGVDETLLKAMAAQESCGNPNASGSAIGLMQIEKNVWVGNNVTAYNFSNKADETIIVNEDKLSDPDYNIKVASMILQRTLEKFNYNIPISLQAYNLGEGNMSKVLSACSTGTGTSLDDILANEVGTSWKDYLKYASGGDTGYTDHVLSYVDNGTYMNFTRKNGETIDIVINNAQEVENSKTK